MTQPTGLAPYFERREDSIDGFPADTYIAGFRSPEDDEDNIRITLPGDIVDRTVLTGAQLSIWLRATDGKLILDGEGLGHETLEAALEAGPMRGQTLLTLIQACTDPKHLAHEADPIGDLTSLRAQLAEAMTIVDTALEQLEQA